MSSILNSESKKSEATATSSSSTSESNTATTPTTTIGNETPYETSSDSKKTSNIENLKSKEEEICDNWEQLDQQKIAKSLQSIKLNPNVNRSSELDEEKLTSYKNSSNNNNALTAQSITFLNNSNNTNPYPQQSIKILKRPASDKKLNDLANQNLNNNQSQQPIKTFEQREQEYAQARLRILGSAHPDEDPQSSTSSSQNQAQSSSSLANNINNNNNNNNNNNQTLPPQGGANAPPLKTTSSYQNFAVNNCSNTNNSQQNVANKLIREPIAPDPNFKGFKDANIK